MEPRRMRWIVTALAVGGLVVGGGLSAASLNAAPMSPDAMQSHVAHAQLEGGVATDLPLTISIADGALTQSPADPAAATTVVPVERQAFRDAMRKLWEDHIVWTRLYIISAAADLPDQDLTAQRLLRNQAEIGNAVKIYYGEEAGNELTELLEEHILGAADLLAAAKTGDQDAVNVARANWYANADAIAAFLSGANPEQWPLADLQAEMAMHLDVTLEEATARLNGDFETDIAAYDKVHDHILAFADLLSNGIIEQFPDRFDR